MKNKGTKILKSIQENIFFALAVLAFLVPDLNNEQRKYLIILFLVLWVLLKIVSQAWLLRRLNRIPPWLFKILNFLWHPFARLMYVLLMLMVISVISKNVTIYLLAGAVFVIYTYSYSIKEIQFKKAPLFSDGFDEFLTENWLVINGTPHVDEKFGPLAPSLVLPPIIGQPENTFIMIKDLSFENGIIEFDAYFKPNALVNLVFRSDKKGTIGYMARIDTRGGNDPDRFLEKTNKNSWEAKKDSQAHAFPEKWYHIKLEVDGSNFKLLRDEELVASWQDDKHKKGYVGIFNECNEVHIDNFVITKK